MSERLIIRLASTAVQKIYWLIWSDSDAEAIESGVLDSAEQLNRLTEAAQQYPVICLLPGVDVCIREVAISGSFNRQMRQALPYLLEEELACDVETLHFSVLDKQSELLQVAICAKQKMSLWLQWLDDAQITCLQFIPEGLTLPVADIWQAVQLDEQWLIRESSNSAWSCEEELLDSVIASKSEDEFIPQIESFSPSAGNKVGVWTDLPAVPPMELLAQGCTGNKVNLLTDEFKPAKQSNVLLDKWKWPVILTISVFILAMANLYLKKLQIEKETQFVKQHVESVYKQAFPEQSKLKYSRIKKKIRSMLAGVEGGVEPDFLFMLNGLVAAFDKFPQFTLNSIKFDDKKQEMQLSVNGSNFQSFDKFSALLEVLFKVEQGALNKSAKGVTGLLTIRIKQ